MATVCARALVLLRIRSLTRLDYFLPVLLNSNGKQLVRNLTIARYYSKSDNIAKTKDLNDTNVSEKAEKAEENKITLQLPDNSVIVTDLENANKLSKRRGLVLIKVEEAKGKTIRPVYKLINQIEHLKQELGDDDSEKETLIKNIKTVQISAKITLHDLNTKLRNINRLLEKKHRVKVILAHGSAIQEKVIKTIENSIRNHGTIQRNAKSSCTIFTITPILSEDNKLDDVDSNKRS